MFGGEIDLQTNHHSIWIHGHKRKVCPSSNAHKEKNPVQKMHTNDYSCHYHNLENADGIK